MSTFVASSETAVEGDNISAVLDEVLQLILCSINRLNEMENVASQWAPIFALKSSRYCLLFICFIQRSFFLDIAHVYFQFAEFFAGVATEGSISSESLYK